MDTLNPPALDAAPAPLPMAGLNAILALLRRRRRHDDEQVAVDDDRAELFHADGEALLGNGWLASSIELKRGLDISEQPLDTLPGDLIDAFLRH